MSNAFLTRIKELKLRNFKSFKKADIPFSDGFTAIMGPNGSGKSNVLDAILFVFGVTSLKSIRAKQLTDLVYHAAPDNTARVSVHLEGPNEKGEKTEYVVTRSIDKQGKSFYKLDGKRVTRNKIHSFLTSLGVSTNGYNVVLQGDVDRIIEMGPTERRQIVDEVAGIAEYEEKKAEAFKQLDEVNSKTREWGIVKGERKGNLEALEKDREAALKFQELNTRLKRVNATILSSEIKLVLKEKQESESQLAAAEEQVKEVESQIAGIEGELRELDEKIRGLQEKALKVGGETNAQLAKQIADTGTEMEVKKSQLGERRKSVEKNKAEIESLKAKLSELNERMEKSERSLRPKYDKKAEVERQILQLSLKQREALKGLDGTDSESAKLETQLKELSELHLKKKEEYYSLKAGYDALAATQEMVNASDPLRGDKLKRLEESVSESSQKLKQALTELGALSKEKEKLYSEEKKSNAGYASLEEQIKEVREQYVALKSKLSTLHASSLGKNIAIESLLAAAKRSELKGVHGPVAELCKYDSKHAQAIETAAGAKMFFIVVEDEDSAIKCINYLKENRLGRAGFIPLNKIKPPRVVSQEALGKPGVMGTALDLVGFDSRFKPAFSYVFGDTLVIDKVSRAKEVGVGVARMVSLDGDLIESSGVMLGGARDTRKATISEGKELNALNDRVSELEQEKKNAFKDLEKLRANLSVLLDSEGELELKVRELETQKKSLEAQLSELRGLQKKGLARDGKDVPTLLNEKREEMHSVSQQISTLESQKAGVEKRLQERRSTRVSLNLEDLEKQLSKLREERMAIEVEIQSTSSTQEQGLNVLKKEHEEKVAALEGEVKAFHAEISTLESRLKELEKHKEQKQVELQKSSKEVEEIQARVSVLESKAQGLAVNRGKLESRISSIRSGVTDASVRKAMFETRLLDLQREMENYPHVEPLKESAESLKDEKVVLQSKIGELGAVNMKAIEDYEVLSQRVKEIEEKINVLGKEKDAVLELIKNIDARRVNAFMSSYSSIRSNFEKMYAGMTKGKGSLKLSDDQNPLNSGLFIEASPDGRTSLKHIDALSGGEKALTSMAFLFAIQRHKPAPFYVLDECDAALDKVNSEKIGNLFTTFSRDSQFITITHNEVLLKNVDQIVGVAKGADGTSVIGVKLPKGEAQAPIVA